MTTIEESQKSLKNIEEQLLTFIAKLENNDKRWASIAKTHFEEGVMALMRSISEIPKTINK